MASRRNSVEVRIEQVVHDVSDSSDTKNSIRHRIASFGHAFRGVGHLIRTQPHARFHLWASFGVIGLAAGFRVSGGDWLALTLAMGLVWTAEAMNTAIELTVDLARPEFHELAGRAKDVAAGGVLLAAIAAAVTGGIVLGSRVVAWWS